MTFTAASARRAAMLALAAVLAIGTLAACGSDDDDATVDDTTTLAKGSEETTTTTKTEGADSPEDVSAPMPEVLASLPEVRDLGNDAAVAAGRGDWDAALAAYDELQKRWEAVEEAVKDADRDAHESIETAHGLIEDGAKSENLDRVTQGAEAQRIAIDGFIEANS